MGAIDYEPVFDVTNTFCFSKLYGMKGHTSYLELSTYAYFVFHVKNTNRVVLFQ